MEHLTYVKEDFPDGWDKFESSAELLFTRLEENGFKITSQKELSADHMVLDARPHTDQLTLSRKGRDITLKIDFERDLRRGIEFVRDIHFNSKQVKFIEPPDRDIHPVCAAIEYWVRDLVNYLDGKPVENRKFDTEKWDRIRREEHFKAKQASEARWNDYLKHPDKYFGPPPRIVEPQLYPNNTVAVIPTSKPVGLAFALKFLDTEPLKSTSFRKGKK